MARVARITVAAVLSLGWVAAQEPPAADAGDPTVWSAQEAGALSRMQRFLGMIKPGATWHHQLDPGGVPHAGYRILFFVRGELGDLVELPSKASTSGVFMLGWPLARTANTRRGIMLHADGTTLVTVLADGDKQRASSTVVVGKGSQGEFADALRQPGMSSSGHLWLWLAQVSSVAKFELVDEHGAPRREFSVQLVARSGSGGVIGLPIGPWPISRGITDELGCARLSGPLCNYVDAVLVGPDGISCGDCIVERIPGGLRLMLHSDVIRMYRRGHSESSAIGFLKKLCSAQSQCQASNVIDADRDGVGEYAFFGELLGEVTVRGDDLRKIQPPILDPSIGRVEGSCIEHNGYLFAIFLPDAASKGLAEASRGGGHGVAVDPDGAERAWCAYAWPVDVESGRRCFFHDHSGDVLSTPNTAWRYCGRDKRPRPTAAYVPGSTGIGGQFTVNAKGDDGFVWRVGI